MSLAPTPTITQIKPPKFDTCVICGQQRQLHFKDTEFPGPGLCGECVQFDCFADRVLNDPKFGMCRPAH